MLLWFITRAACLFEVAIASAADTRVEFCSTPASVVPVACDVSDARYVALAAEEEGAERVEDTPMLAYKSQDIV